MSWGKILLVTYLTFIGVMLFMVVKSFQQDFDMVNDDYYAAELKFQDQIDATANAAQFADSIIVDRVGETIHVQFPSAFRTATTGELYFYKASDADKDVKQPLLLDGNGNQQLNKSDFSKGFYTVKINWEKNNVKYYTEKELYL